MPQQAAPKTKRELSDARKAQICGGDWRCVAVAAGAGSRPRRKRTAALSQNLHGAAQSRAAGGRGRGSKTVQRGSRRPLRHADQKPGIAETLSADDGVSAPKNLAAAPAQRNGDPAGGAAVGRAI